MDQHALWPQSGPRSSVGLNETRRSMADSEEPPRFSEQMVLPMPVVPVPMQVRAGQQARAGKPKRTPVEDSRKGHRERLRTRFIEGGAEAMPDYEMLELILCRAMSRCDVKPLAKDLLKAFGSFNSVINAPPGRLAEVSGVGPRIVEELKIVRAAALRMLQSEVRSRPALASWQSVIDYVKAAQAYDDKEAFRILFLDKRNQLIADEVQNRGTVDHTPVYVREVIARSLEVGATAIILVHNHPSGDPSPSRADIDMTKLIMAAGQPLGVTVHDHIIVGRQGHLSMKAARLV
jgi:DNA repair protein RadC